MHISIPPPSPCSRPPNPGTFEDRDHRLGLESQSRQVSTLRASTATLRPDTIPLGTARPTSDFYPWKSARFQSVGSSALVEKKQQTQLGLQEPQIPKLGDSFPFTTALGYGPSAGVRALLHFLTEHVRKVHNPPYRDWRTVVTCGTTSGLEIILRIFCSRGDTILTESYTYAGFIEATRPLGIRLKGIAMDEQGLRPEHLDQTLSTWDEAQGPKPFLLYTIPCGQNPTGTTQSAERRRAVYELAEKHDLLIIEDDPYYYLQLDCPPSGSDYLARLPPSYLSLDTASRVLRLDSTSKILAPGLRVGWLTGPSCLIERFLAHTDFSTMGPSGISQFMLYRLLAEEWGQEGFLDWLACLSGSYRERREVLVRACEKWLPRERCSWRVPKCGMFVWIGVECAGMRRHLEGMEDRIFEQAAGDGVLVAKGSWSRSGENRSSGAEVRFRLTFAAAKVDGLEEGVRRFREAVKNTVGGGS